MSLAFTPLAFPPEFVWGVATSAYQIEGAYSEDGRGTSIWDTFCRTPGKVLDGHTGDVACDHYHLWEKDLDLVKSLGVRAYRFSVAWPRVVPEGRGTTNPKGLAFYDRLVDGILARGLEPHCTLYHWDLPQPLEDRGGWLSRETAYAFAEYADTLSRCLGDRVATYATLNEPWCSAFLGYFNGHHAPGHNDQDMSKYLTAVHHLLLAHGLAMPILRQNAPGTPCGIVLNLSQIYPERPDAEDVAAAERADTLTNRLYLEPLFHGHYPSELLDNLSAHLPDIHEGDLSTIAAPLDFLGENYYTPTFVRHDAAALWPHVNVAARPRVETTAMGWEVYAQGLTDMLVRLSREYQMPIFVTENGAAYADTLEPDGVHDTQRVSYYERHIAALEQALTQGADVRGYFAWSLMDNFEWAFGYDKRFGIVYVDFDTQKRTLKDSAKWYQTLVSGQSGTGVKR